MFLSLMAVSAVASETFFQRVRTERQQGLISEAQALMLEALGVYAPEKLPEPYRSRLGGPMKCTLGIKYRVRERWSVFSPEQQAILEPLLYRPDLPDAYLSLSGLFKMHYTTTGYDAVSAEDADQSGVPDFIEEAGRIFDTVYAAEVTQMGFNPPMADQDRDGPEWDIYFENINAYGGTVPEILVSEDPDLYSCYMEVDNDFSGGYFTQGLEALRVTAAHEFFHMIQLGYNGRDENQDAWFDDRFFMEVSSVWMEDAVFDGVNDYYQYLGIVYHGTQSGFFDATNLPFDWRDGWREYGLGVWLHFLVARFGDSEIVRDIWEAIVTDPAVEANDRVLQTRGSGFDEELALFYGWNCMTGSRADTLAFYPEGHAYPEIQLDGTFVFAMDTTLEDDVNPAASKYFRFSQVDGTSFTLIPTNVNRSTYEPSDAFRLILSRGQNFPVYTDLGYGVQTRLISEDFFLWKCVAVVESPGQATSFIPFDGTQPGSGTEETPGVFPNPFVLSRHAGVTVPFVLDEAANVLLRVFSSSGYRVREEEAYYASDGLQYGHWDGRDEDGEQVPSGIYVCVVTSGGRLILRDKLAVVR